MLQMLRKAAIKVTGTKVTGTKIAETGFVRTLSAPVRRSSPYRNYMCYQDGQPFMIINAPSLDHARFIIAGFSADHTWMLVDMPE